MGEGTKIEWTEGGNTLTITDFQGLKTDEWPKEIRVKKFPRSRR